MVVPAVDAAEVLATPLPPACGSEPWSAHAVQLIRSHTSTGGVNIAKAHLGTAEKPPRSACMRAPRCHVCDLA